MKLDFDGGVGILTLDRPEKRNALSAAFVADILGALDEVEAKGCSTGVLQAEGPIFCAGADKNDVSRHADEGSTPEADRARPGIQVVLRFMESPTYWVAAAQGPAIGAGLSLLAVASEAYMSEDSWLSIPEIDFDLFPAFLLRIIAPLIGRRRAFELATTGRRFSANEAVSMGLITKVAENTEDVQQVALATAHRLAHKPKFVRGGAKWWNEANLAG